MSEQQEPRTTGRRRSGRSVSILGKNGRVTIPKPLRDRLGIEPGQEIEFEEREGALIVRQRPPLESLRSLVGLIRERIDVDAYLEETRGPRWLPDETRKQDGGS